MTTDGRRRGFEEGTGNSRSPVPEAGQTPLAKTGWTPFALMQVHPHWPMAGRLCSSSFPFLRLAPGGLLSSHLHPIHRNPPQHMHAHTTLLHALLVAELNSKAQAGAMSMAQPSEGPWAWSLRWPSTPSTQGRVIPAGAGDIPSLTSYEAAQEGRRWSTFEPLFSSLGMGPAHFPKQMSGEGGSGKSSSPLHRPGRPPNASRARSPGPIVCGCSFSGVCWRGDGPWC